MPLLMHTRDAASQRARRSLHKEPVDWGDLRLLVNITSFTLLAAAHPAHFSVSSSRRNVSASCSSLATGTHPRACVGQQPASSSQVLQHLQSRTGKHNARYTFGHREGYGETVSADVEDTSASGPPRSWLRYLLIFKLRFPLFLVLQTCQRF